jgi:hypothetical protein
MYLLEDESFNNLLGGEYYQVVIAKQQEPNLSIKRLYDFQFNYFSYQGFCKFYHKHLEPIIDSVKIIDDNSILGKILRWLIGGKNK